MPAGIMNQLWLAILIWLLVWRLLSLKCDWWLTLAIAFLQALQSLFLVDRDGKWYLHPTDVLIRFLLCRHGLHVLFSYVDRTFMYFSPMYTGPCTFLLKCHFPVLPQPGLSKWVIDGWLSVLKFLHLSLKELPLWQQPSCEVGHRVFSYCTAKQ